MSNENNMSAMDDSFREMEEETERLRQEQELEAQEAEFRIQQEAQEFDAYKQGLVEEFKNAANDGDSAQNELEASTVEQNQAPAEPEMATPEVDAAEVNGAQTGNEASEMLDNLTARAENILEGELNGAPLDMNNPAQMAMLESITEFVTAQQFTDVSPELLEAVQAKVQEQVIDNANDAAELAAAAPAIEVSAPAPAEPQVTVMETSTVEIAQGLIENIAESMGGEEAGWDDQKVMETLSDIRNGEIPAGDFKESFEAATVQAFETSSIGDMTESIKSRVPNMSEEHLENAAVKDLNNMVQLNGMMDKPEEVTPMVMDSPAANSTNTMAL